MMRRFAVGAFEEPAEMEPGKAGFVGNILKIDRRGTINIYVDLRPNNLPV